MEVHQLSLIHIYNDAGNALVVGLFRIKTEGVVIPRPLNEDLIFTQAVRSMRTAEPHQRLVFGILAFGSTADDALVNVEVFLVAVNMTVHELLQLRNDVNVCVFLHASPFSQLHVVRFEFDRGLLLRLLFCGSFELITDGWLFLLLLLPNVFQRRHQLTDVYKRQDKNPAVICQSFSFEAIIGGSRYALDVMENIDVPSGMGAVSYTHLDVYKRQEMYRWIDNSVHLNVNDMFDAALRNTRIEMSPAERRQFYEKHIRHMTLTIDENGNVSIELKRG